MVCLLFWKWDTAAVNTLYVFCETGMYQKSGMSLIHHTFLSFLTMFTQYSFGTRTIV